MKIDEKKSQTLTKREAVMLIFLAVFGFGVVMIMFVIIPLFNNVSDLRESYNQLTIQRTVVENMLNTEDSLRQAYEEAVALHSELSTIYVDSNMHSAEIGRMIVLLSEAHDLEYIDQRLSNPTDFHGVGNFTLMRIDMNLRGTYTNLINLLNTVYDSEYLRISQLSFTNPTSGDFINRISVTFEVTIFDSQSGIGL